MALRPATDEDWEALTGNRAPAEWFGLVYATEWLIEGIGAIYRTNDGSWWITFERTPGVRKVKTAHAAALRLLEEASVRGLVVHAIADPSICGSVKWVERLGFRRTGKMFQEVEIWDRN